MSNTAKFIILAIVGIALVSLVFWLSQPRESFQSRVITQKNRAVSNLQERSTFTNLPITYSAEQVGKSNPFE